MRGPAELEGQLRGPQQPAVAGRRVEAELDGALQGGDRHADRRPRSAREAASSSSAATVSSGPRAAAAWCQRPSVRLARQHGRERLMGGRALVQARPALDGRADQRMTEPQPARARVHQPRGDRRSRPLSAVSGAPVSKRRPRGSRSACRLRSARRRARRPGVLWQFAPPGRERLLDAVGDGRRRSGGKADPAPGERAAGQLAQRERVAERGVEDLAARRGAQPGAMASSSWPAASSLSPPSRSSRPARVEQRQLVAVPGGPQHDDGLCLDPPPEERQDIAGGRVQPVRVVGQHEQRLAARPPPSAAR